MAARKKYTQDKDFWQNNRNNEIAIKYAAHESSISRRRDKLIKEFGKDYECKVVGWYGWSSVNWELSDDQILASWKGRKTPKIETVRNWRKKIKIN